MEMKGRAAGLSTQLWSQAVWASICTPLLFSCVVLGNLISLCLCSLSYKIGIMKGLTS
jgi:hypothetical protein